MTERDDREEEPLIPEAEGAGGEPTWTDEIRRLRRARGDRLRELFDTAVPDEDEPE